MSALQIVRCEQIPFFGFYEYVFERTKIKMNGYVVVQRKLLAIIYSLWEKDEKYALSEGAARHRPQVDVPEQANINELLNLKKTTAIFMEVKTVPREG